MEENEKLHKIRVEIEKAKQEKQQAERQLVRAENRLKCRENMSRKARTHRLIVLGAVMAQYFPELKELSEVQLGQMMEHLDINALHEAFYKDISEFCHGKSAILLCQKDSLYDILFVSGSPFLIKKGD